MSTLADVTFHLSRETKTVATPLFDGSDSYFFESHRPHFDYSISALDIPLSPGFPFAFDDVIPSESSGLTSSAGSSTDFDDNIFDLSSPFPSEDQPLDPVVFNTNIFDPAPATTSKSGDVQPYFLRNPVEDFLHSYFDKHGIYPKLGLFDDYQSESESEDVEDDDEEDADGGMDDGDYAFTSFTPYSVSSSPSDVPGPSISSPSPNDDSVSDCSSTSDASDDDYEDQPYDPRSRRASSLPATFFPATDGSSSSARVKYASHSTTSSPKRKFEALEEDADEEVDRADKPYKTIRESSGKLVYQCRKCPNFRTKASGDMRRHLESLIHRPPSYRCNKPGCDKLFTRKDALKRHKLGIHGDGTFGRIARNPKASDRR